MGGGGGLRFMHITVGTKNWGERANVHVQTHRSTSAHGKL